MTTQYTPILKLALPVTGELSGTWGTVVNDNITSMVEQAVAGLSTINTWTTNAHTLTTADGTSSEARCAMLVLATGSGGTALTGAGEVICPAASKLYVVKNGTSYAVTLKTSGGSGVAVPAGDTAFLFCDGTNVNACVTTIVNGHISGNLTVDGNTTLGDSSSDTITATAQFNTDLLPSTDNARDLGSSGNSWRTLYCDTSVLTPLVTATNLQVTNIKANDGTAAMSIADSTGAVTVSTILNVDNLRLDGNTLSSTDSNGNVVIAPNGTGDVQLDADTVRVGDSAAAVTLTSNGAGALTVTTGGAADLVLNTNSGTNSGSITIGNGTNGNITVATNGTGDFYVDVDTVRIGDSNANATLTTNGTGDLILNTNSGTNSGSITIQDGVDGNIIIAPNGNGQVQITNASLDLTTIEVTNIKAKDGTAAIVLTDSTGAVTISTALTANGGAVFNENGANVDFRVEGDNEANLLFVDASADAVGIGTSAPVNGLSIIKYGTQWTGHTANTYPQPAGNVFFQMQAVANTDNWFGMTGNYGATTGSANFLLQANLNNVNQQAGHYIASQVISATAADLVFGKMLGGATAGGNSSKSEQVRLTSTGTLNIVGAGTAGSTQAISFNGSTPVDTLVTTSGGDVGIGTNAPGVKLDVSTNTTDVARITTSAASDSTLLTLQSGAGVRMRLFPSNGTGNFNWQIAAQTNVNNAFEITPSTTSGGSTFSTPAVIVTSDGNLGIGTSSPAYKLDVQASGNSIGSFQSTGANYAGIEARNSSRSYSLLVRPDTSNALVIRDETASANRVSLDSSGNLGLGVTPNANWSTLTALQIKNAAFAGYANSAYMLANAYYDGSVFKYIAADAANRYQMAGGQHEWYTSTSTPVIGNDTVMVQAMTLDASGNLLVGTTSAANANAKIRSSSGIEYSNSVLFNVQNPNGKVFTVTGGSNGSSTFVEIEVLTYEGYFKAVYFCINSSGSWENDKYNEVTSGTPATVTVAGNNTATMTFTVACTTSFTPLMRVAMGNQYASMA